MYLVHLQFLPGKPTNVLGAFCHHTDYCIVLFSSVSVRTLVRGRKLGLLDPCPPPPHTSVSASASHRSRGSALSVLISCLRRVESSSLYSALDAFSATMQVLECWAPSNCEYHGLANVCTAYQVHIITLLFYLFFIPFIFFASRFSPSQS